MKFQTIICAKISETQKLGITFPYIVSQYRVSNNKSMFDLNKLQFMNLRLNFPKTKIYINYLLFAHLADLGKFLLLGNSKILYVLHFILMRTITQCTAELVK